MAILNKYIANINRSFKDIKLDIMANFIWADYKCLVITTNKVICYELKSLELDKRTNSYIRVNTRELNRDPFTNWSTLYTTTDGPC